MIARVDSLPLAEPRLNSSCILGLCLLSLIWPANAQNGSRLNLIKEEVVPDVLNTVPPASLGASYENATMRQGNELEPKQTMNEPTVSYDFQPDALYTLAMVDPDAPSRQDPTLRELLHFLVSNIPGGDVSQGDVFAEYIGAGPPKGTGLHRYVLALFRQVQPIRSDLMHISKFTMNGRPHFSLRNFSREHNLGEPLAANFFQAQWDESVPELEAQLSSGE